jgi:RNA polymerase sigma-70 factor (ECF subfamily)
LPECAILGGTVPSATIPNPRIRVPGTPSGFDEFYAEHFTDLAVQLYAYLGDLTTAETLTHEAFCRAALRWDRIRRGDALGTWVRRTAWALASRRRHQLRARGALRRAGGGTRAPEPGQVGYLHALSGMPARPRRVFVLYHLATLPLADIADQEGVRLATVRAALQRAQQQFARAGTAQPPPADG